MPRQPRCARTVPWAFVAVALTVVLGACGQGALPTSQAKAERSLKVCHAQWRDVGETVLGMDEDPNPSALADRWNAVVATVQYYENSDSAKDCQARVEAQLKAVTSLREFSAKLRPYDMTYQLAQSRAAIDLYLHEPLPAPVRGENGKPVRPPTKAAVSAAMQVLSANATQANQELAPGWEQTSAVDLTDAAALTRTMQDLDFLAQDSPHWRRCEDALQVLIAAIHAQEGVSGEPSNGPTDLTTPTG